MNRRLLSVLPVVVASAVAGCGGGGGTPSEPSPPPSATVSAAATATATATVVPVAARKAEIRAEVKAIRANYKTARVDFYRLDTAALKLDTFKIKADTLALKRLIDLPDGADLEVASQRIDRLQWASVVPYWTRAIRKLRQVKVRGAIGRSARAFQGAEWGRSLAFQREYLRSLRTQGPANTHDDYYDVRAVQQFPRRWVVVGSPATRRGSILRALRAELRSDDPAVGDAYRKLLVRNFIAPRSNASERRREIGSAYSQWLLWRIGELEQTPEDVYEAARATIELQSLADWRNPYARLRDVGLELVNHFGFGRSGYRQLKNTRAWALGVLARPVAPILEPQRDRMVALFDGQEIEVPARDDYDAQRKLDKAVERDKRRMKRVLRRGAETVDSTRGLRAATIAAVAATRP